jgi:hypothetical protein
MKERDMAKIEDYSEKDVIRAGKVVSGLMVAEGLLGNAVMMYDWKSKEDFLYFADKVYDNTMKVAVKRLELALNKHCTPVVKEEKPQEAPTTPSTDGDIQS